MPEAVVCEAVRTPIGKRKGSLSEVHPVDLSAAVLAALAERTGIDPGVVDDVVWGCVNQVGDQAAQIGRYALLAAGWPETVPGVTINRACGSSQSAFDFAAGMVLAGQYDVVVAGGVESMTRVPLGAGRELGRPYGPLVRDRYREDLTSGEFPNDDFNQGVGAERIARDWGLSRTRLDEYAAHSHELAAAAIDSGAFDGQLVDVPGAPGFAADEGLRRGTTAETLAALKPVFSGTGVIHAGNSSQISDGASAVLVTTPERAAELGLTPIVRYHSGAVSGADPLRMLTGPIPATQKVLKRSGLAIGDIGAFEVNEAFAPVPLAWQAELGADDARLNPLGGAIAVGHPLGASGTILLTRLVHHMRDRGIRYGLQTMCEGGGTANATVVELV
ncbi:3-ketoacyl-CoA thiolase, Acetyl-CoA acetyltransferase [Pseudonocardia sp. Ae168_Ps1]|uniref:thiolase family protein n=1 Tax=unclassified Pseudonocardia TaxID=2619320 RepID=UPI00094B3E49|nr:MULTISPECIES: thiolase family protein [unclassified Pseudonocardia]OLL76190.1 3-ketoacyl-CoA thiolase Acetyl-CoA acetyltransferase [Pseudonocardia sp. Ae150A_Ps1]OLL82190.1 3-ketoacyl-CoA thiolase, Acetyl-CoA acetyltransferase [Pseudonocardia sp. Ae168_Ps1]OLL83695.1 3-ketoacyl-CoA thiolase, Acetyl-CoA acetyltransferase [Pseudonocardia sp. Ae263_Ps1]OLL90264.1 3-ketoacyl-CoA thiolase, Acetyl-CoA acetyltransferase [Pseudonocardia sp. Ae356_Ps1]